MSEKSACGLCCTQVKNLGVTLGGHAALSNINLHVHCGEITALIGPNGAGKTTLLRALLGEVPYTGSIDFLRVDGEAAAKPRIGYVPQRLDFDRRSPITVLDLFAMTRSALPAFLGATRKIANEAEDALAFTGARHVLNRRLGALSGGELQRVLLALALTPTPDILLLDEPVSGVDNAGLALFYGTLDEVRRRRDLTILLVTHDLAALPGIADRVVLLEAGRIIKTGSPAAIAECPDYSRLFPQAQKRVYLATAIRREVKCRRGGQSGVV